MTRIWKSRPKFFDGLIKQLFALRGLTDAEKQAGFQNPRYEQSHDPLVLQDMELAVTRIASAIQNKEQITVYADYDADAVTAAAAILRSFERAGYKKIDYYIPDRFSEGYGMNVEAVKLLAQRGTNLIITVDCGINAVDPVDVATYLGLDVVITDHHQLTGALPKAMAVVNPHRDDDIYPDKDLTGVGVAFKLVQALVQKSILSVPRGWEKWLLDLVAIGTVADCQSVLGENRIFVKWGLHVLEKTRWMGLRELMHVAGIADQLMDSYKIGFVIAPRINAAGRIEHANLALDLLLTNDQQQAKDLATKLESLNKHRQNITEQILSEAREQLVIHKDKKILLAAGEGWPKGVVGLVAGKLTEEFARPVFVLEKGEHEATGSARSIGNFNIVKAIAQSQEILVKYGGHPMAAGFTLLTEHIDQFHQNLLHYAEQELMEEDLSPVLHYDAEINLTVITPELVKSLEQFAPFGLGNPRPRLRLNNLVPRAVSAIGNQGKHLRLSVGQFGCVGFNLGFWVGKLQPGELVDIICEPQFNDWNGKRNIQLKIIDLRKAE